MLEKLGERNGYSVKREKLRIDMVWIKDSNVEVAVDHENEVNNVQKLLEHEVDNLLSIHSKLKIFITYFTQNNFHRLSTELNDAIMNKLSDMNRFDFEFLVALSPWENASEPKDQFWVAYLYKPTFKSQMLLYP